MKLQSDNVLKLIIFPVLIMLVLTGCSSYEIKALPPPPKAIPPNVSYHVWGTLVSYGIEQNDYPGYAVYTYVLFNSNRPDLPSSEGKRYESILWAVLHDVKSYSIGVEADWPRGETNIFCIPYLIKKPQYTDGLDKYDFELSLKYLAVLQGGIKNNKKLFKRLEQRPGPFLVSLYSPLPMMQGKDVTKMLYLDLTDMPADGMRQVLDAYKQRLDEDPLKNVEKLKESLKIILMKYALMLDENITIVDVAFAKLAP